MENNAEARLYDHVNQLLAGHEKLLSDANRNRLFYRALKKTISDESSVLDIGSGTGVWAIAAAALGARRVVAIEQDQLLIGLIRTLARDNGVASRVEVIQGDSRQVQLNREFDVVISETMGSLVFDEHDRSHHDRRPREISETGRCADSRFSRVGCRRRSSRSEPPGTPGRHSGRISAISSRSF